MIMTVKQENKSSESISNIAHIVLETETTEPSVTIISHISNDIMEEDQSLYASSLCHKSLIFDSKESEEMIDDSEVYLHSEILGGNVMSGKMETENLEYVFYPSMAAHSLIFADKSMLYNADEKYLSMESHRVAVYEYAEEEMYRDVTTKEESANEIGNKEAKMLEDISVLQENENLGDPRITEPGLTTDRMIKIEDVDVNKCTDKTFDNYSSNTEGDSYRNQILRIENLRKIVEDELGEFEKTKKIEHDTNTSIMNIKDIEFPVMINLHQHNEETLAIMESRENLHIIEEENLYIDDINVEKQRKNKDYKYSDISSEKIDDEESEILIISKEDQIQENESM